MEDCTGRVESLQLILDIQSGEDVFGVTDRQVGRVGVIRCFPFLAGRDDVRIFFLIMLGQSVSSGLCRSRFQVVEIMVHFLILNQSLAHVVEDFNRKFLANRIGQILS